MPQSMQRAPWAFSSGSASGSWYSMKSCTRTSTGRFGPLTRWILRKPPISPIARQDLLRGLLLDLLLLAPARASTTRAFTGAGRRHCGVLVLPGLARPPLGLLAQAALVVHRHDLHPCAGQLVPPVEHAIRHRGLGAPRVLLNQSEHLVEVLVLHLLELDELRVATGGELALRVEH